MHFTLYTNVQMFYTGLIDAISQAQQSITRMYYTFDL
jgi:hypothetical protein